MSGTKHSSTVARRVAVPARGKKLNATLPSGQDRSLEKGGLVIAPDSFSMVLAADAGLAAKPLTDFQAVATDIILVKKSLLSLAFAALDASDCFGGWVLSGRSEALSDDRVNGDITRRNE